jgi:hypothetical protein
LISPTEATLSPENRSHFVRVVWEDRLIIPERIKLTILIVHSATKTLKIIGEIYGNLAIMA